MCVVERQYIRYSDGRSERIDKHILCHKSKAGRLCRDVETRNVDIYRRYRDEVETYELRPSSAGPSSAGPSPTTLRRSTSTGRRYIPLKFKLSSSPKKDDPEPPRYTTRTTYFIPESERREDFAKSGTSSYFTRIVEPSRHGAHSPSFPPTQSRHERSKRYSMPAYPQPTARLPNRVVLESSSAMPPTIGSSDSKSIPSNFGDLRRSWSPQDSVNEYPPPLPTRAGKERARSSSFREELERVREYQEAYEGLNHATNDFAADSKRALRQRKQSEDLRSGEQLKRDEALRTRFKQLQKDPDKARREAHRLESIVAEDPRAEQSAIWEDARERDERQYRSELENITERLRRLRPPQGRDTRPENSTDQSTSFEDARGAPMPPPRGSSEYYTWRPTSTGEWSHPRPAIHHRPSPAVAAGGADEDLPPRHEYYTFEYSPDRRERNRVWHDQIERAAVGMDNELESRPYGPRPRRKPSERRREERYR